MPELPQEWEPRTLRDAALPGRESFIDGDWIEAPYITDAGIRLIQTGNVGVGTFIDKPETRKYISPASYRILNCTSVNTGDVLICRLADPIGRACEVPATLGEAVTAVDCTITRVDQSRYDKSFLLHWLNSDCNLKAAADMAAGSTRSRISRSNLGRLPLPRPPLDQQVAIGRVLDTLDTTIRQTEAIIEKLKLVKQGLLHDLLTRGIDAKGELRPPHSQEPHLYKHSPLGWIPREWTTSHIGEEADIRHGFAFPGHLFGAEPKGYRLLVPGNFSRFGGLDFSEGNTKYFGGQHPPGTLLKDGEALIVMTDLSPMTLILGRAVLLSEGFPVLHNQRIGKFVFRRPGEWHSQFFVMLMNDDRLRSKVIAEATGTTVRHTSPDRIKAGIVAKPIFEEQAEIANRVEALLSRIRAEEAYSSKLRHEKSGLMDDLLTGRVRVSPLLA